MNRIVMDLDETICSTVDRDYENSMPRAEVVERMREFKRAGYTLVINTSRNMNTYKGNLGRINTITLPLIVKWLERHNIPYDEIYVGKPWCGTHGFYVDDRAIRPSEFVELDLTQIEQLLNIPSK